MSTAGVSSSARRVAGVLLGLGAGLLPVVALAAAGPGLEGPLTLGLAKQVALRDNPGLHAAAARVEAAAAVVRQAKSAYYPALTIDAAAQHTQRSAFDQGGDAEPEQTHSLSGTVSWLVFDGFARRFRVLAAQHARGVSAAAQSDAQRLLLQAVATAFYTSLLAQENINIARQDAEFNRELSAETRKRFEAGAAARSEVLNFDIRTAQAESELVNAEFEFRRAKFVLAELLGIPDARLPESLTLAAPWARAAAAEMPELEAELEFALAHRPDFLGLHDAVAAQRAGLAARKGEYWPTVSVQASGGGMRADDLRYNDGRDDTAWATLALNWNVFSGGRTRFAVAAARRELRALQAELTQLRHRIVSSLRQQMEAVHVSRTQLDLRGQIAGMTMEVRDLVRNEYLAGKASLTRLNEAQTDLVRASGLLALSRIRYWQALEDVSALSARNLGGAGM